MSAPTEIEVSYAILIKLAGNKEEADRLILEARQHLKPKPVDIPPIDVSKLQL